MATINEIKQWLTTALKHQNVEDFSVNIVGNSEKGDGYVGDILFVNVKGTSGAGKETEYNLVLKCSKKSSLLREQLPVKYIFLNEIYIYDIVIPAFTEFHLTKGVTDYFNSIPKYYGKYVDENAEILILENLKKLGYDLWDRKKPLTTDHLHLVLKEYGKLHASSIVMQEQEPEKFAEISTGINDMFKKLAESSSIDDMFGNAIDVACDMVKDQLSESLIGKWKIFRKQLQYYMIDLYDSERVKVITHGDCWNNNFLFYSENEDQTNPSKVAFLDWQISKLCTPIRDLSYFLFSSSSKKDLNNLDHFLEHYYNSFSTHVKLLGSDPEKLYPFQRFQADWKKFCKFGIIMSILIVKLCLTEKKDVVDVAELLENGTALSESFSYEITNKEEYVYRVGYLMEYVARNNLI